MGRREGAAATGEARRAAEIRTQGLVIPSQWLGPRPGWRRVRGAQEAGTRVQVWATSLEKFGYKDKVPRMVVTQGALGAEEGYFKLEET